MDHASRVPTSPCYFCNDPVDVRFMAEHVQHCGAVLEECPEKCGSYVPRRGMGSHRRHCVKIMNANSSGSSSSSAFHVAPVKNEVTWRDNVFAALNLLRSSLADAERERQSIKQNLSMNADRLDASEKRLESLSRTTMHASRDARQRSVAAERGLVNLASAVDDFEKSVSSSLNDFACRLENLERELDEERTVRTRTATSQGTELRDLKKFVARESAVVGDLLDSLSKRINDLKLELEIRCKISRELENKQDVLSEKIDIMVDEIRSHGEEMRRQGDSVRRMKSKMKEVFALLEDLVERDTDRESRAVETCVCGRGNASGGSTNGRLLWRIDRYKEKMSEAKETESVLCSPVFYNKEYGYALRMELLLNGRGQWKGRHVIGRLRVVDGPWDPLLDWPCVLRAAVTLRDQDNPANDIRKIVKTVSQRLDEGSDSLEKNSGLDMFIPHTSLTRYDGFTKHDALFIDIRVTELEERLSRSSLAA